MQVKSYCIYIYRLVYIYDVGFYIDLWLFFCFTYHYNYRLYTHIVWNLRMINAALLRSSHDWCGLRICHVALFLAHGSGPETLWSGYLRYIEGGSPLLGCAQGLYLVMYSIVHSYSLSLFEGKPHLYVFPQKLAPNPTIKGASRAPKNDQIAGGRYVAVCSPGLSVESQWF